MLSTSQLLLHFCKHGLFFHLFNGLDWVIIPESDKVFILPRWLICLDPRVECSLPLLHFLPEIVFVHLFPCQVLLIFFLLRPVLFIFCLVHYKVVVGFVLTFFPHVAVMLHSELILKFITKSLLLLVLNNFLHLQGVFVLLLLQTVDQAPFRVRRRWKFWLVGMHFFVISVMAVCGIGQ